LSPCGRRKVPSTSQRGSHDRSRQTRAAFAARTQARPAAQPAQAPGPAGHSVLLPVTARRVRRDVIAWRAPRWASQHLGQRPAVTSSRSLSPGADRHMKSSESPRSTVFIPYWLVLPLLLFGLAGFLAVIVIGVLSGFWLVIVIGSALSAWHIVLCVRLIRMGRRGWNERAGRQGLPSAPHQR
jgi:hypothetical protein